MIPIESVLPLAARGVVSLTGGGGKTSLMFHLARRLSLAGKKVLTTTTTKIFLPTAAQSATVLVDADPQRVLAQAAPLLQQSAHISAAAAHLGDTGKLKGFAPETIAAFEASGLFDWIIVEADGSARRPLKAPAEHEPVIPANTSLVIAVAGLEVLGHPLSESLVFRAALAGERMGLREGDLISEDGLVRLFRHPLGLFKGTPHQAARFIFLNKADDAPRREGAAQIAALLRQDPRPVADAVIVGQAREALVVHACHPLRQER